MPRKSYKGSLPKPDSQGRWRPVVGRSHTGRPQRFHVGNKRDTTEAEAQRRLSHIRDFYDRQCVELGIDFWAGWTLPWAIRLASGPPIMVIGSDHAKANNGQAAEEWSIVKRLQSWGVPIQVADSHLHASGQDFLRNQIETEVNRAVEQTLSRLGGSWGPAAIAQARHEALPPDLLDAETRTLHEALDAYAKHLSATGRRDGNGNLASRVRKCQDRLGYLKEHHDDIPLWKLTLPVAEKMAAYWRNRPPTKRGNRTSWDHAHDMNKELFRFLDWLDSSPAYNWIQPKGLGKIKRSPEKLPEDETQEAFQTTKKKTYTPEQLAAIARVADPLGKAIIGTCVNCAFGASEVGQWPTNLYSLHKAHPHADRIGIESLETDSWIVGRRPKTGVYGEHLLWPQVAEAVAPFLDGREVLPITSHGKPWYRTHASNPQTSFARWWNTLVQRAKKRDKDLPELPFGSLRDVLPNILRREYSDHIASISLQHKQISSDDLLECYANVPFKKLFDATRELGEMFRPFLDSLWKSD